MVLTVLNIARVSQNKPNINLSPWTFSLSPSVGSCSTVAGHLVVLEGSAVAGRLEVVAQLLVPHDVKVERENSQ
jgi:hypothetical protein